MYKIEHNHTLSDEELARRIVAAMNAVEGIETEVLEKMKAVGVQSILTLLPDAVRLKEQNARLRGALKKVVAISDRKHDAWNEAKAALAEAEQENTPSQRRQRLS